MLISPPLAQHPMALMPTSRTVNSIAYKKLNSSFDRVVFPTEHPSIVPEIIPQMRLLIPTTFSAVLPFPSENRTARIVNTTGASSTAKNTSQFIFRRVVSEASDLPHCGQFVAPDWRSTSCPQPKHLVLVGFIGRRLLGSLASCESNNLLKHRLLECSERTSQSSQFTTLTSLA